VMPGIRTGEAARFLGFSNAALHSKEPIRSLDDLKARSSRYPTPFQPRWRFCSAQRR
jgi:hypothetical protein